MSDPAVNPYASPASDAKTFDTQGETSQAEAIRREHIGHETSLKSVGLLYLLGAILLLPSGGIALFVAATTDMAAEERVIVMGFSVFYLVMGVLFCALFSGFRKLRSWVKIPATIVAAIGLLGFPLGTLINGYILWLMHSQKGSMVFSSAYQDIIAQTPHVKYRTSPAVWILLLVVGLLLIGGCLAGIILE